MTPFGNCNGVANTSTSSSDCVTFTYTPTTIVTEPSAAAWAAASQAVLGELSIESLTDSILSSLLEDPILEGVSVERITLMAERAARRIHDKFPFKK